MDKFLNLVQKSVVTTVVVTLALTGVLCYLWIAGRDIPSIPLGAWLFLLGISGGKLPELVQALKKE